MIRFLEFGRTEKGRLLNCPEKLVKLSPTIPQLCLEAIKRTWMPTAPRLSASAWVISAAK